MSSSLLALRLVQKLDNIARDDGGAWPFLTGRHLRRGVVVEVAVECRYRQQ